MTVGAGLLGQVEVVLDERVLGAEPAAGHALAALGAVRRVAGRRRRSTGRRPRCSRRLAEEDADRGAGGRCRPRPCPRRPACIDLVGRRSSSGSGRRRASAWPGRSTGASSARQSVMSRPLRVVEERLRRLVQGVGVVQRAAADARAGQDQTHGLRRQQVDALDAVAAQLRRPQVARRRSQEVCGDTARRRRRSGGRPRARRPGSPSRSAAARSRCRRTRSRSPARRSRHWASMSRHFRRSALHRLERRRSASPAYFS